MLLTRQFTLAHQKLVDGARRLATFADGPHHQRLAAAHVTGGKHLGHIGDVAALFGVGFGIAASGSAE